MVEYLEGQVLDGLVEVQTLRGQHQEQGAYDVFVVVVQVVDGVGHDMQQHLELVVDDPGAIDGQYEVIQPVELGLDEDVLVTGLFHQSPQNVLDTTDVQVEVLVDDDALQEGVDLSELYSPLVAGQVALYFGQDALGHFVPLVEVHLVLGVVLVRDRLFYLFQGVLAVVFHSGQPARQRLLLANRLYLLGSPFYSVVFY